MKLSFLLVTFVVLLPCLTFSLMNFPHVIWVYWETDFEKAPLITRVSYEKLVLAAKQVNWTVNLVTGQNIHEFITDMQEFNNVVKRGRRQTVQQKSDLLRIWLVEENGGVWIDFACIPLQNFDWLRDYSSYQHMIINRRGTNLDDPEIFMLGEGWHQSPLSWYNSDGNLITDEYFGMAIHFIAAKKKTRLMTDWKNKMKSISAMTYDQMLPEWKDRRLFFHNIDRQDVYYSGNVALESTLQLKQLDIDKNLTLFSNRLTVYEYYKIWCIHGQVGPIGLTRGHAFKVSDIFLFTRQQAQARAGPLRFYLKIAAYLRVGIQGQNNRTRQYLQQHNKTLEDILRDGPNQEQCQKLFIVQGSILHTFYNGSKYFSELRVPIITKDQRDFLRKRCMGYNPRVYKPIYEIHSVGSLVSPQREIYAKDTSIKTQLWVFWLTHNLSIHQWMEKHRDPILLLAFYGVLKLFFGTFLRKIAKRNSNNLNNQQSTQLNEQMGSSESGLNTRSTDHSSIQMIKTIVMIIFVGIMYMTFYQLFDCLQAHGKFPMYDYAAIMVLIMFGINEFVKRQAKSSPGLSWFVPLQTINLTSRMFLLIYTAHFILMHFHVMWFYAYRDVLQVVGMGYLLYVIYYELQQRKLANNKFHDFIVYFMGRIIPCAIVIFFCFVAVWRNPMYLASEDNYLRLDFINGLRYAFDLFGTLSIGYFWVLLIKNLIVSYRPQQSQKDISAKLRRQDAFIFILSTIYWLNTYYRIYDKYEELEKNFNFDHQLHMKYFMIHFAVFEFGMRLRMPEHLALKYKIIFYILSFTYAALFCIYGFELFRYLFVDAFYIKVHFSILTFLLALLALAREKFSGQQSKISTGDKNYQQLNESGDIPMSDVKIRN